MATRKPSTSRAPGAMAAPASRPASRPALSTSRAPSSASSSQPSRSSQPAPAIDADDAAPLQRRPVRTDTATDGNIQVVVRCRGRSTREAAEQVIVSSEGAKSSELTIKVGPAPPTGAGAVPAEPPTRTYPFDLVFGPDADQALLYQEVVAPMLEEVLHGYNCTLFAYGQTGTGKTHTMQGDLVPTALGNPSANAGMIPRVLFRLFHHLETKVPDFTVKVSYVELYNEELRDLLTPVPASAPELKIFDDASKKGVFIQGLEEVGVRSAAGALAILTRGSERRQIAATRFNDHSSRSHAVFSLTVHTKETSTAGEELLRVGKMNLVDLAGSENVGRSGAVERRAKEAGMINQSLLTLGRVINALADRGGGHVPYRESKLTRLLQDSLGGRTKTCIVATVSPAACNAEETLSTLDYALRAKSIRNKPELNQRLTRNALLREYVAEIERLKADVRAARDKTGVFVSDESFEAMEAEQARARADVLDARKHSDVLEGQMRNVREEFEQSMALLVRSKSELAEAQEKLDGTERALGETRGALVRTESALAEEVVVRAAHAETEEVIDQVAGGLRQVASEGLQDLEGVFSKLDRKASTLAANTTSVHTHGRALSNSVHTLDAQLRAFGDACATHAARTGADADALAQTERAALAALDARVAAQTRAAQDALGRVRAFDGTEGVAWADVQAAVGEALGELGDGLARWAADAQTGVKARCAELQASTQDGFASVEKAMNALAAAADATVRDTQAFATDQLAFAASARQAAADAVGAETARLRAQNAALARALEAERARAGAARDALVAQVGGLLADFAAGRDAGVRAIAGAVEAGNRDAEAALAGFQAAHAKVADDAAARGLQAQAAIEKRGGELKRTRDGAMKALTATTTIVVEGAVDVEDYVSGSVSGYAERTRAKSQQLQASYTSASDILMRTKRVRIDAVEQMALANQQTFEELQGGLASSSKHIVASTSKLSDETSAWHASTHAYVAETASGLGILRDKTQALLDDGTREDVPTGMTPQKRRWDYADQWERTKGRDALLREWRAGAPGAPRPSTLRSASFAAPESAPMDADADDGDAVMREPEDASVPGDEEAAEPEPAPEPEPEEPAVPTPPVRSMPRRMSSATAPSQMAPPKKLAAPKSGIQPPKSALAERSANVVANRRRLR